MDFDNIPFGPAPSGDVTRPNEAWDVGAAGLHFEDDPLVMLVTDVATRRPLSATVSLMVIEDVVATLQRLVRRFGSPEQLWMTYGISYHSRDSSLLHDWAERNRVSLFRMPLQTKIVSDPLLISLGAFLRNKRPSTLIELGLNIERWRQSYATDASALPNINQ